jgi:hypothetical protein
MKQIKTKMNPWLDRLTSGVTRSSGCYKKR